MAIIHYENGINGYLCSDIINPNTTKMSSIISNINCDKCIKRISINNFSVFNIPNNQKQTSLTGLIF